MKKSLYKRDLFALAFIAVLGLATLFLITTMSQPTGSFVYAGTAVQLTPREACDLVNEQCTTGPAEIVSTISGSQFNAHPGQYTACICPEDVFYRDEKQIPRVFDESKLKFVRTIQQYREAKNFGQS